MANVVLFHHALGLTDGVLAFANQLRAAGHAVTVPDLYEGRTFDTIEAGVAHAEAIGFEQIIRRGVEAAAEEPDRSVYAGFSLGVLPAQRLARTRGGALGAILLHSAVPASTFGTVWPTSVALQIHVAQNDPWVEMDVARRLAADVSDSELFVYPGAAHLVADSSFGEYDAATAELILDRATHCLSRWA